MSRQKCRLCGRETTGGMYCESCVPNWNLRKMLNQICSKAANMMMVDWRARNGLSVTGAAARAHMNYATWRRTEDNRNAPVQKSVANRISKAIGVPPEELFAASVTYRKKPAIRQMLAPGENQKLIADAAREARARGMSYGQAVAAAYAERMG